MKYIFLFAFFWGPFCIAQDSEEPLGLVRILNTNPPSYDQTTGTVIPGSRNTVFTIKDVVRDPGAPNNIWLVAENGGQYDAILVYFNSVNFDNDIPKKFIALLQRTPKFQIDLNTEDIVFETLRMKSFGKVKAKNVRLYSDRQKNFIYLKDLLCPVTQEERRWWDLGKYLSVREDCP